MGVINIINKLINIITPFKIYGMYNRTAGVLRRENTAAEGQPARGDAENGRRGAGRGSPIGGMRAVPASLNAPRASLSRFPLLYKKTARNVPAGE